MKKIFILFFVFTVLIFFVELSGCTSPVTFSKETSVKVILPQWPSSSSGYPELDCWEIIITTGTSQKKISVSSRSSFFTVNITPDELTSIVAQPLLKDPEIRDFFYPCGCVYPADLSGEYLQAEWNEFSFAKAVENFLSLPASCEKEKAVYYINWKKLKETLLSKDEKSFSGYDTLKTKKCTTSSRCNFEKLTSDILSFPSRVYPSYSDTASVPLSSVKNYRFEDSDSILFPYIPLNAFCKEKGCLIVSKPESTKTAFILNGQSVYIKSKKLYFN